MNAPFAPAITRPTESAPNPVMPRMMMPGRLAASESGSASAAACCAAYASLNAPFVSLVGGASGFFSSRVAAPTDRKVHDPEFVVEVMRNLS